MNSIKGHLKETLKLAYPVMISQLGTILMGIVDTLMVGELGAVQLAAAAVANSIFILIFIVGMGISYALTPLVAIAIGAGKHEECGTLFRQSLIVNMSTGIILMILTLIFSELIQYFNQPPEVVDLASSYAKILAVSIIPLMFYHSMKQFIEGFSVMQPAMVFTLIANVINYFGNWLLIYGNLGFPALGLDGSGYATLFARIFLAVSLFLYVISRNRFRGYIVPFRIRQVNIPVIKKILRLGVPSGFQYFFEVGAFSFAIIMVGWLGTKQLAAHEIAINLASISFMAATGISAAGSIRVGNALGMEDVRQIRTAGFSAVILGAIFMAGCGLIFVVLRNFLPSLYIDDTAVISMTSSLLIITAVFQISDGVQAVGIGILRGLTDVKIPTVITFFSYWILALPAGYFFGFSLGIGIIGVWIGLLIGLTSSALLLTLRFNTKSRRVIVH